MDTPTSLQRALLSCHRTAAGAAWQGPHYRQIDLFDKRKQLGFLPDAVSDDPALCHWLYPALLAQRALQDAVDARSSTLNEGLTSWQIYQALPRRTPVDKLMAEVFRMLRIVRIAATHAQGRIELREGQIRMGCTFGSCALSLHITPAGLALLGSLVHAGLDAGAQPYSETYIEWWLGQHFTDVVQEVKKFADEDRILYQFQHRKYFNRHFRLDCDNPRIQRKDEGYVFEVGRLYENSAVYPIDFYVVLNDTLHIVPAEALQPGGYITHTELRRWHARCSDQASLPATFKHRFGRERMVVGLPMT